MNNMKLSDENYLKPSDTPLLSIEKITPQGQHPVRRMYMPGYENFMALIPKLNRNDPDFTTKLQIANSVMERLLAKLQKEEWVKNVDMKGEPFGRTILGLEEPRNENGTMISGAEIVIGHWNGYSTPIHGHAPGLSYEGLIFGKTKATLYSNPLPNGKVRAMNMKLVTRLETFTSLFNDAEGLVSNIHKVEPVGLTATLHFFNEHTRDAKGNTYEADFFEDHYNIINLAMNLKVITPQQSYGLKAGDVVLVRDNLNNDYGDYFSVITDKGDNCYLREVSPKIGNIAIPAGKRSSDIMDNYFDHERPLLIMKLSDELARQFREFHFISPKEITFEQAMNGEYKSA